MIGKILKTLGLGLFFLALFLVITFPFSRLQPKARRLIEGQIYDVLGFSANCSIDDFDLSFPFGIKWSKLTCVDDLGSQKVVDLGETSLTLLPKHQVFKANIGKGSLTIKANAGFKSPPTRIESEFTDVPLDKILPMVMGAINRSNPQVPKYVKAEGKIQGKFDLPLKNLQKEKGSVDLQFTGLKFPPQSQLDLIGIKDLSFSKSSIKVSIASGKINFQDVNFSAQQLSGKVEGSLDVADDFKRSVGNISLKWKIEKSDAVLSSLLGPMIANNCPSPDSEGFCTKKIQRFSDFGI